uniref:Uncharacterized protein n=1 Tax=Mycena chlorophos TaxID=658473 RepID=A0ABQ0M0H3_MYCCL|nr:predicted protein [Mycena chlorophos]
MRRRKPSVPQAAQTTHPQNDVHSALLCRLYALICPRKNPPGQFGLSADCGRPYGNGRGQATVGELVWGCAWHLWSLPPCSCRALDPLAHTRICWTRPSPLYGRPWSASTHPQSQTSTGDRSTVGPCLNAIPSRDRHFGDPGTLTRRTEDVPRVRPNY